MAVFIEQADVVIIGLGADVVAYGGAADDQATVGAEFNQGAKVGLGNRSIRQASADATVPSAITISTSGSANNRRMAALASMSAPGG